MCGIVGYAGSGNAPQILVEALKRLEYRGYDSSGIALHEKNGLTIHKKQGRITVMEEALPKLAATVGIGHTRWATHGEPSDANAHPQVDSSGDIAVIHNGTLENYADLRSGMEAAGIKFNSGTDTEVLPHLIERHYDGDLLTAVRTALGDVTGAYAIAVLHAAHPGEIVAARNESPLVIGFGEGEHFIASDAPAIVKYTQRVAYVRNGELVCLTADSVEISDMAGNIREPEIEELDWSFEDSERGGYAHYMLKEIFEQPRALQESLLPTLAEAIIDGLDLNWRIGSISIVACGTSLHAGMVGKYVIEQLTAIPVNVCHASEFRYSPPVQNVGGMLSARPLVVLISQSGETADTLAAARVARQQGSHTVAICNVGGSSLARNVDGILLTHAGPEIGVAATKTFLVQMQALYMLAVHLAYSRKGIDLPQLRRWEQELRKLPHYVGQVLERRSVITKLANSLTQASSLFFIGRNLGYPIALEGALKLKEISYLHAEGYPAGELKHGPLALLSPQTPVIAIASQDHTHAKLVSNMEEVAARKAPLLVVAQEGDADALRLSERVITLPASDPVLMPFTAGVALQLLAYHVAEELGCDIDKPRNLAKSVTVE
ncbi:MAG: glutamine--fructose-6-phosphate transaminase (isomerizing) [Candidatus Poseidoniia archaeon]|jgi:glucosamine--fructose-6-phosphate aminotransferase (isomerizing)|nr:glutamine--fructose-6-phosphate transaminase (isomerizing) [Euryarchaeota archaeon]MDP6489284.1 glutamine--fructose-6-phosphate transaminase (isomerizing) [Candidatus Poseidoniia archaeon]MDP6534621.1 glutamine--fructose-6-phosphate transaminase (isomerizing) [Candidatus Poseidoniia archaeon]MDP6835559.1 glutamine--fructose-6-phosphate transaminase (isomerizing) [Candidatus Poseidoniia archaeon]HIH79080.1 glutamine--fructose-6-phosphate transaminase (isomerizing) [Candidatus Poseidoniia arch|tara:strand:- start:613 stop:2430 length:1818 start_codon:yes stop_codon:yes gene_type:complete